MERKTLNNQLIENLNFLSQNLEPSVHFLNKDKGIPFKIYSKNTFSSISNCLFAKLHFHNNKKHSSKKSLKLIDHKLIRIYYRLLVDRIKHSTKNLLKYHSEIPGGNLGQLIVPKVFYFKV